MAELNSFLTSNDNTGQQPPELSKIFCQIQYHSYCIHYKVGAPFYTLSIIFSVISKKQMERYNAGSPVCLLGLGNKTNFCYWDLLENLGDLLYVAKVGKRRRQFCTSYTTTSPSQTSDEAALVKCLKSAHSLPQENVSKFAKAANITGRRSLDSRFYGTEQWAQQRFDYL